jgi:hypothetical protein
MTNPSEPMDRRFDPAEFPHGIICPECSTPLTNANGIAVPDGESEDGIPIEVLACIACVIAPEGTA